MDVMTGLLDACWIGLRCISLMSSNDGVVYPGNIKFRILIFRGSIALPHFD